MRSISTELEELIVIHTPYIRAVIAGSADYNCLSNCVPTEIGNKIWQQISAKLFLRISIPIYRIVKQSWEEQNEKH